MDSIHPIYHTLDGRPPRDKHYSLNKPIANFNQVTEDIATRPNLILEKKRNSSTHVNHSVNIDNLKLTTTVRLSKNTLKKYQLLNVKTNLVPYSSLAPLHQLWTQYARAHLQHKITQTLTLGTAALHNLEFQGALVKVIRAKCPSYVDQIGIVIQDNQKTFLLATPKNRLVLILKKQTVFEITIDHFSIIILGEAIQKNSRNRVWPCKQAPGFSAARAAPP